MASGGVPATKDAYNNIGDNGDMSTMFGNDRGSIDLTQRSAMGGDTMPSARMPGAEWIGDEQMPQPPQLPQLPQPSQSPQLAQPQQPPNQAAMKLKTDWQRARLERLPNGVGIALFAHPTVRALLDEQYLAANPHNEAEQLARLGVVVGQLQEQLQTQRAKQQQAKAQEAQEAQAVTKPGSHSGSNSKTIQGDGGGIPMWWFAVGIAALISAALVVYAWSAGYFSSWFASSVSSSPSSGPSSVLAQAPMSVPFQYSPQQTPRFPSAGAQTVMNALSSAPSVPPAAAFETLAALGSPPMRL